MDVIFVASWYPSKLNPELGNFVQRHAEAVASAGAKVRLVHIAFSNRILFPKMETENVNRIEILHLFLPKIGSQSEFVKKYWVKILLQRFSNQGFKPEIIHCHVAYPAGDYAISISKELGIPLVYTEHMSRINRTEVENPKTEILTQIRRVAANSAVILPVSTFLANLMREKNIHGTYEIIENCVDTSYFYPLPRKNINAFTFLHVSNFEPGIKNTEGILSAFSGLEQDDTRLIIAGDGDLKRLKKFCESENINTENIRLYSKLSYSEIARLNQASDCFVLFSNSENLPCVVAEALCCGNPVISTDVGGLSEMIDNQNGILIPSNDVDDLRCRMVEIKNNYALYDRQRIALKAIDRYCYKSIGDSFMLVYRKVLNKTGQ